MQHIHHVNEQTRTYLTRNCHHVSEKTNATFFARLLRLGRVSNVLYTKLRNGASVAHSLQKVLNWLPGYFDDDLEH